MVMATMAMVQVVKVEQVMVVLVMVMEVMVVLVVRCLCLVGSCTLVAAGPRSCATMTAAPIRSWWQGLSSS